MKLPSTQAEYVEFAKQHGLPYLELSPDEEELLGKYRNATPEGKATMQKMALEFANQNKVR